MNREHRDSLWLRHLTAFAATLLLGVAIAAAQNKVAVQGNAKDQPAAGQAKAKPAATADEAKLKARRGHALGMTVDAQGDHGIVISKVEEAGVAAKAGLRAKDRIVSVDNRPFKRTRQFEAYLASHGGRPIPIVVVRDGQQQTIVYTPPTRAGDSAWLGVYLEEDEEDAKGAKISQVFPGGPGARGGLHPGDIITMVADEKITSPSDLIAAIAVMAPQTEVQLVIQRNDAEEKLAVTLGAQHAFAQAGAGSSSAGGGNQQYQPGHEAFDSVPPAAMQLEHDRRIAEQHQRIENEIRALREELKQLREELKQRK
jgi:predicted metalloprotease with PDZ domain